MAADVGLGGVEDGRFAKQSSCPRKEEKQISHLHKLTLPENMTSRSTSNSLHHDTLYTTSIHTLVIVKSHSCEISIFPFTDNN